MGILESINSLHAFIPSAIKRPYCSLFDFLFNEEHYERCLVSSFQFLYKLPDDPQKPAILYLIARSYEGMENYNLARRYYNRVMNIEPETSVAYTASKYRETYSYLMEGDNKSVLINTEGSDDPYDLTRLSPIFNPSNGKMLGHYLYPQKRNSITDIIQNLWSPSIRLLKMYQMFDSIAMQKLP